MGNKQFSRLVWRSRRNNSVSWLSEVRAIHNMQAAKDYLGLSFAQMGREIARVEGRPEPYAKMTVVKWTTARRAWKREMNDLQINAVGVLIVSEAARRSNRDNIGIRLAHNSPWKIAVMARCLCGEWYEVKRPNWRGCKKHRGE